DMTWNDVGSWRALREVGPTDDDGNVVVGDVVGSGLRNSYVRSEGRLVVATDDAVLVAHADAVTEVSTLVEKLRQGNRPEPSHHLTTHRPWGNYRTIDGGSRFQ